MEDFRENVCWFPGHMKAAKLLIFENLKKVDVVFEIVDARAPISSRNDFFNKISKFKKPRIILLSKSDLADSKKSKKLRLKTGLE